MPGPTPDPQTWSIVSFVDPDEAIAVADSHNHDKPLLLVPPPGAAGYLGLDWFHVLGTRLGDKASLLVDCGSNPALTHEALAQGFTHVGFSGDAAYWAELETFTAQKQAVLYSTGPIAET
ncbi:MAG: hypothetical protein AAGF58_11745 [Pseudomonadota bacterium]